MRHLRVAGAIGFLALVCSLGVTRAHASRWLSVEVAPSDVGYFSSIAVGGAGAPHIAYSGGFPGYELMYACRYRGGWQTELVGASGYVANPCSLALDGNGSPH